MKYDKQKIPTISSDKICTCYICNIIYYIKKCRFLSSNVTFLLPKCSMWKIFSTGGGELSASKIIKQQSLE